LIWLSLACSGPVLSQTRICSSPVTTCLDRSFAPWATCWPAKVSSSATMPRVPSTTSREAALRGIRARTSRFTTGITSAVSSIAITSGSTTTENFAMPCTTM